MSSPTTSLVRVDAFKIREIAEKIQARINSQRKQKREEYICEVIERESRRWFRQHKSYSWENAAKIVDTEMDRWGFFTFPWWRVKEDEFDLASRLLTSAELALDNEIWLNLKDAETVQKWMVEEKENQSHV